ncbi:oligopeptide ABC transporter substrate-binding protein [Rubeoparvulum massiliense]|uniref:oligopeptide ABC transporter substrate-binding protein n=1 Tax=Rubeoparvulum massiliense TaxID=1631346 RepID=UPI0009E549AF|nr:oligopeptide ABC transporter substrate-binding protein [Rubeoparvulum massiliense]
MKLRKSFMLLLTLVLALSMILTACGGKQEGSTEPNKGENPPPAEEKKGEEGAPKEGGVVVYGIDAPPSGVLDPAFIGNATDSDVAAFMHESMFTNDENIQIQPNLATWETEDNKVYTFKLKQGVKWHNGEELTMEDWKFAMEVLAHPDYTGPRFNYVEHIEGAVEMKDKKADAISGLEIIDPYTMKIAFIEARVNNLENLWSHPMPKKHFEGVEIAKMEESEQARTKPVGLGPFKVKSVVPGEYVEYERFDDYWDGKPLLDGITVKVIDPSLTVGELQNENIHIMGIKPTLIPEVEALPNMKVETARGLSYSYVGFKMGTYDKDKRVATMDRTKFHNKNLRKAMFYALDREAVIDAYLGGVAEPINTPVPSVHWIKADESLLTQYNYDPEKAKQLLAEAGYKDIDGDGFVEDPEGKPLTMKFQHYQGPATFEGRAQALTQMWRDIGLNVTLEPLKEGNLYYDLLENDDPEFELFFGGWVTGSDPDPKGLWLSTDLWNFPRWINEESDALLHRGTSEEAFDIEKRKAIYIEWQKIMNEELPILPLWENVDVHAINAKLKGVTVDWSGNQRDPHKWYLEQ